MFWFRTVELCFGFVSVRYGSVRVLPSVVLFWLCEVKSW